MFIQSLVEGIIISLKHKERGDLGFYINIDSSIKNYW